MYEQRLRESLPRVEDRIAAALARSGRAGTVQIVAVTKGHPVGAISAAVRAGLRAIGENRVHELEAKRAEYRPDEVQPEWHLIGHLQRNKVRKALRLFDCIHSLDSLRLARELSAEAQRSQVQVRALVQVNVSGEATKGGFDVDQAAAEIAEVVALPGLSVAGLMTMAPLTDDETVLRATFGGARVLLDRCVAEGVPLAGRELSMGMSGDYEVAIEEGSTMVRLGTVLFGERVP
jgi:pyridoxal phosphate enzyme (YggS family)